VKALGKLASLSLVFFLALEIWCVSMGAAGASQASSVPGCSQGISALEKAGCDYPAFICPLGPVFSLPSEGAFALFRDSRFSKDVPCSIMEGAFLGSSLDDVSLREMKLRSASVNTPAQRVSIHLFNSILSL
jgi:hypothetical protein